MMAVTRFGYTPGDKTLEEATEAGARVLRTLGREDEAVETVALTEDLQESVLRLRRGCP